MKIARCGDEEIVRSVQRRGLVHRMSEGDEKGKSSCDGNRHFSLSFFLILIETPPRVQTEAQTRLYPSGNTKNHIIFGWFYARCRVVKRALGSVECVENQRPYGSLRWCWNTQIRAQAVPKCHRRACSMTPFRIRAICHLDI